MLQNAWFAGDIPRYFQIGNGLASLKQTLEQGRHLGAKGGQQIGQELTQMGLNGIAVDISQSLVDLETTQIPIDNKQPHLRLGCRIKEADQQLFSLQEVIIER
jgi:hypothetical protein